MGILEKQVVDIPMGAGMNEAPNAFLLASPYMDLLENVDVDETGAYKLRRGYDPVGNAGLTLTQDTPANALFTRDGQLCMHHMKDGTYVWSETAQRWVRSNVSAPVPTGLDGRTIVGPGSAIVGKVSSAFINGYICVAWVATIGSDTETRYLVYEEATGAEVLKTGWPGPDVGDNLHVVGFDTDLFAIVGLTGGGAINGLLIDTSTSPPTASGVTSNIVTNVDGTKYDVHGLPNQTFFNIVAVKTTGGPDVIAYKISNALAVSTSITVATPATTYYAVFHNSVSDYVFCSNGTSVYRIPANTYASSTLASSPAIGVGSSTPRITMALTNPSGNMLLCVSDELDLATAAFSGDSERIRFIQLTDQGVVVASTEGLELGCTLDGKAFYVEDYGAVVPTISVRHDSFSSEGIGSRWLGLVYTPDAQGSSQGADMLPRFRPVAKFHQDRVVAVADTNNPHLADNAEVSATKFGLFRRVYSRAVISADQAPFEVAEVFARFKDPAVRNIETASLVASSGALPMGFDGDFCSELAPMIPPAVREISAGTGGGARIFRYKFVWVFFDASGNAHRGRPSEVVSVLDAAAADSIAAYLYPPPMTSWDGEYHRRAQLEVYRGEEGGPATGPFFFLTRLDWIVALNSDEWVVFNDTNPIADSDLTNIRLYTDSGEVPADCPPPSRDMALAGNRLWSISAESDNELWFTKELSPALAPEFSNQLTITVGEATSKLTALASLDEKVIIFTESELFYAAGSGPNPLGLGSFVGPHRISADIGCVNKNSVATCVQGVLFESSRGIYLLGRDLSLNYIGEAVEELVKTQTIQNTIVVPHRNQIRFIQTDQMLVFDYLANAWSKYKSGYWTTPRVGCVWNNKFVFADDTQNTVFEESTSNHLDNAARIVQKIRTPWIKIHQLQGLSRVWRVQLLGNNDTTGGDLKLYCYINYDDSTPIWNRAWRKTDRSSGDRLQLLVHNPRQKVDAIKFEVTGEQIGGGDPPDPFSLPAKYTIAGISLVVGAKTGLFKLPLVDKQ